MRIKTAEIDDCPCGTSGIDCADLVSPLTNISNAVSQLCDATGFDHCLVTAEKASCECKCGYNGEFCENPIKALTYNFIGGYIFVFVFTILSIYYLKKKYNSLGPHAAVAYGMSKNDFVTSDLACVSPTMILIYRIAMLAVFFPTIIAVFEESYKQIVFFTNWTFILFGMTFLVGTALSIGFLKNGPSESQTPEFWDKTFLVFFEIELPSAFSLSAIVWISRWALNDHDEIPKTLYIVHGLNVLLLMIGFYFNKLYFAFFRIGYLMLFVLLYEFFQLTFQLYYGLQGDGHCPFYPFLDMSTPYFMLLQFVLLLIFVFGYWIFYKLSEWKKSSRSQAVYKDLQTKYQEHS